MNGTEEKKADRIADEKEEKSAIKFSFYLCDSDETATVNGFGRKHQLKH